MSVPAPKIFMDNGLCHTGCNAPLALGQTMCWKCQMEEDEKRPKMVHPCDGCKHLSHESLTDMGRYRAITVPVCKLTGSGGRTSLGNTIVYYEMTIARCDKYEEREVTDGT